MKKGKILFACLSAIIFLTAFTLPSLTGNERCDFIGLIAKVLKTNYETVEVEGLYSIKIPDYMDSLTSLNDEASLQYSHLINEKYIIVIHEDKQEFVDAYKEIEAYDDKMSVVDNYSSVQLESMSVAWRIKKESELKRLKINGMDAQMKAIDANVEGIAEPINYWLSYVEGKENMYTIMVWTLESRKDSYEEEANEMIKSLREL